MDNVIISSGANKTLLNFVRSIAASYPKYTFNFQDMTGNEVLVICDYGLAGRLGIGMFRGAEMITLNSKAIRAERSRKGPMRTKDTNKAAKLFAHYFNPPNLETMMGALNVKTEKKMAILQAAKVEEAEGKFNKLITNISSLAQLAKDLDGILDLSELHTVSDTVLTSKTQGVVVAQRSDKYFLQYRKDCTTHEFTADTLPNNLRASIAMLKMVDVGTVVADRGVRIEVDLFMVLEDNNG